MNRKIRLLHIIPDIEKGGAEKQVLTLLSYIDKNKFDCSLVYFEGADELREQFENNNVNVIKINQRFKFNIFIVLKLIYFIKKNKYDVVHTHLFRADLFGTIAAKLAGIKIVLSTKHNDEKFYSNFIINMLERINNKLCSKIITITDFLLLFFRKKFMVNEDKIKRIYYGLDTKEIDKDLCEEVDFNILINKRVFCCIARLTEQKGLTYLIKSFRLVVNRRNDVALIILGRGKLEDDLREIINTLNLNNHVFLYGFKSNALAYLKKSDFFILPSLWEGLGLVFLEALYMEKPIITTYVSSIPEILGENAIYVKPQDINDLAEKMLFLLNNPEIEKNIKYNSSQRIKEFSVKKMVDEYESVYLELYRHGIN